MNLSYFAVYSEELGHAETGDSDLVRTCRTRAIEMLQARERMLTKGTRDAVLLGVALQGACVWMFRNGRKYAKTGEKDYLRSLDNAQYYANQAWVTSKDCIRTDSKLQMRLKDGDHDDVAEWLDTVMSHLRHMCALGAQMMTVVHDKDGRLILTRMKEDVDEHMRRPYSANFREYVGNASKEHDRRSAGVREMTDSRHNKSAERHHMEKYDTGKYAPGKESSN